ncbi:MAG: hypothetical protein LKG56_08740 [Lachnospiraceae bacterium]|jgi:hypothetical protein|nr:hypothetical protein [Lachnospiraceae bacterium]MCI1332363.1 hypothetical protein [Lachnospiraceae bacterium]MCI1381021.1 hypothetical protein [Lachnospiraceae bacterium]MCI1449217.1 hypothetical protein [Lachnospiraceae bacterium]MCI1556649.1 hypothetical protein [Lachnospiraceae bacterium]
MLNRFYEHLMRGAEQRTADFMKNQVRDPQDIRYGAIRSEIREAKPTIYAMATAISVYFTPESRYYHSHELEETLKLAVDFVAREQRANGSFDYTSCNFFSAPDTSFCFKRLIAAYRLLVKYGDDSAFISGMKERYLHILHQALNGIAEGGFHTPNHRWGISAALMQGANLFADEPDFAKRLRDRAAQYLNEGIDGDEDGEYAERSTGNYNAVVNNAMIALYEETGDDTYLGYVRRNLRMMFYYIDPDDTIFTQNSTRQDQGKQMYADKYFYQYLFMAAHDGDADFDAAACKIITDNTDRGDLAPDCWHIVIRHDEMLHHEFRHYGFPTEYRKFFKHAGVLRVRNKNYCYTLINGKSSFLYFKKGSFCVGMKVGESYCDIRNFIPQKIESDGAKSRLEAANDGWYYLPFEKKPETTDWWKMDQSKRKKLVSSQIHTVLEIEEQEEGLKLHLHTDGIDRLPLRVEFDIPKGTQMEHSAFALTTDAGQHLILRDGYVTLRYEAEEMKLGPGFAEHEFKGHYQFEEINIGGFTLYMNAYTPVDRTITIG